MQKITPFLWFDNNAEEAINFYVDTFKDGKILSMEKRPEDLPQPEDIPDAPDPSDMVGKVLQAEFSLMGQEFKAMDAGPYFKFTPAISFMVILKNEAEVDGLWQKLSKGGEVLMPLDKYDFSPKYGWVNDKYGVSWQVMFDPTREGVQTSLLFVGDQAGKAEEALNFYASIFPDSKVGEIANYPEGTPDAGTVMYSELNLAGRPFSLMDSSLEHKFDFNEAVSLYVDCKDQAEVDKYWQELTANGGEESQCGWLKDKYGVSWQIVPRALIDMMNDPDRDKANRVIEAMLKMQRIDVAELKKAYEGE